MAADNTIDYKFFEKEIASKYVMMRNSAMSARVKMNCLTQEVITDQKIEEHKRESRLG